MNSRMDISNVGQLDACCGQLFTCLSVASGVSVPALLRNSNFYVGRNGSACVGRTAVLWQVCRHCCAKLPGSVAVGGIFEQRKWTRNRTTTGRELASPQSASSGRGPSWAESKQISLAKTADSGAPSPDDVRAKPKKLLGIEETDKSSRDEKSEAVEVRGLRRRTDPGASAWAFGCEN